MNLTIFCIKMLLRFVALLKGNKYKYSQKYEDNFKYMNFNEKLWWGYKALIKQIENGEKDKHMEEYFSKQNLNFRPDKNFNVESKITLTAGGDLSCSDVINPESTLHLWDDIEDFYFSGDIACANLESPLDTAQPVSVVPSMCLTAPNLNTSPEMFERYTREGKGVNFFSTANNHSLDMGESGVIATLDFLDSKGYKHVGTSRTPEEQMDIPIVEKNGIKVGILAYTYCLNAYEPIPGKEYMTNVLRLNKPETDITLIKEHVKAAHQKGADIIIAIPHWSIEFETYPIQNIIDMGHRIMECGVDIILGGHPHVAQPMEKYIFCDPYTGETKTGFIVYSLGEMVSYNAFSKNSRLAFTLKLEISKGREEDGTISTKITSLKVMPIYTWIRRFKDGKCDYRLLDFIKTMRLVRSGQNSFGFTSKEIEELKRLENLLYKKLLPEDHSDVLIE